jgi:hypothetical protein
MTNGSLTLSPSLFAISILVFLTLIVKPHACVALSKLNITSFSNFSVSHIITRAISRHSFIKDIIKTLNSSNVETKRAISLNKIFSNKKCRLRIENLTRWSSTYLMLEAVKRAYDRGAFDEAKPCPIEIDIVEVYLQILAPAYLVSIGFQSKHSLIADVLIAVRRLKFTLENMNVEGEARAFCNILCEYFDEKFEYEMNSPIYKVIKKVII